MLVPIFSEISKKRLAECHPDLQLLFNEVIERTDCIILCGHRGEKEQNEAFHDGKSKLKYPQSGHNKTPSNAVDAAPYPVNWNNLQSFKDLAKVVQECADKLGIDIVWGGSWTRLRDYDHWELKEL
jgi:peptidoglycan LD-endopeptidase CwlK